MYVYVCIYISYNYYFTFWWGLNRHSSTCIISKLNFFSVIHIKAGDFVKQPQ